MIAPALYHKIAGSGPHVVLLHPVGLDLTFLEPVAVPEFHRTQRRSARPRPLPGIAAGAIARRLR
ncbi:MAG: hypothetical protein WCB55_04945 [Pseudolabrys sp.]